MSQKPVIKFEGCGGLYHYYMGICACLQDNYDVKELAFETTSGSNFGPAILFKNIPLLEHYKVWQKRKEHFVNNNSVYDILKNMKDFFHAHCKECYQLETNCQLENINHSIKIRNYDTNQIETISNFKNVDDYLFIVVASSYFPLPYLQTCMYSIERDTKYCDGCLDKYWYITIFLLPFLYLKDYLLSFFYKKEPHKEQENEYIIETELEILDEYILPIKYIFLIYYTIMGLFTNQHWLYHTGYYYADKHIKPKLDKLNIKPKPKEQVYSQDKYKDISNFKLKFDINTKQFINI